MRYSERKRALVDHGVYVREMTALQFAEASEALREMETKSPREKFAAMALVCVMSCCHEDDTAAYESVDDVLAEPFSWLERCCQAALEINGLVETEAGK